MTVKQEKAVASSSISESREWVKEVERWRGVDVPTECFRQAAESPGIVSWRFPSTESASPG